VGLFTSPHLVSFRERIQINRQMISEADVTRLVAELQLSLKGFSAEQHPTMFEVVTVMALKFFAEQKCDLVIWETGLGGRLDATNIVTPLASVITNIALDHTQWLGDTLEKIAAEKAGIIKPSVPVITAATQPEVLAVIEQVANSLNASLTRAVPSSNFHLPSSLPLSGEHQKQNATLALATVAVLQKQIPVLEKQICDGLAHVSWPGRLQWIERRGQRFLLDGAHNIAGVEALRAALEGFLTIPAKRGENWEGQKEKPASALRTSPPFGEEREKTALIVGLLADKDWQPMCEMLAPLAGKVFTVPVASERTADAGELAEVFRAVNPQAEVAAAENLSAALFACRDEPFVVITGSLYLIGEALELLGHSPAGTDERGLNEWASKK
jgi:dihydrofolate synthase/folylpolyglutamate synthase